MAKIETIEDLILSQYGVTVDGRIAKDAAVTSSTTGARNAIYSYGVFLGICLEANAYGILPKTPWPSTGYRAVQLPSASSGGGISEGGAIPATVKATYFENDLKIKEVAHAFDMSSIQKNLKGKDDVLVWEDHKDVEAQTFDNLINRMLLTDGNTLASNNLESIDRMIDTTAAGVTGCGNDAGDEDPWALLDRSETTAGDDNYNSWADAYVSHGGSGSTETDREFSLSYIDTVMANTAAYWDGGSMNNKVFLTGFDTLYDWSQEMLPAQRLDVTRVTTGVNGVQTHGNTDAGLVVKAYNGIPIIASNNVPQDTKSRVYLIDLDYMSLWTLLAPEYLESSDPQAIDKFATEGVFHMQGELVATKFRGQGKVRGLK